MRLNNLIRTSVFVILLVSLMYSSHALGITPSRKVVDFTSDVQQEFSFDVVNSENKDIDLAIYSRGDFADYVLIEDNSIHLSAEQERTTLSYKVILPYSLRKPGYNLIEVVVEEKPSDSAKQTTIGGKVALVHQLILKSPYVGSFLTSRLTVNNPDFDQNVEFTFALFNEGSKDIGKIDVVVDVTDSNLQSIATDHYEFGSLSTGENKKETKVFSQKLLPGKYRVKATLTYENKIIVSDADFIVGSPVITIDAISSSNFRLGNINKMDVFVYNTWSEEIKNVFAEVCIKDSNRMYDVFKTISADVPSFSGNTLFGYWDTSNMLIGKYQAIVALKYNGKTTEKEFDIVVAPNEFRANSLITGGAITGKISSKNSSVSILLLAFVILILINALLLIYIRRKIPPTTPIQKFMMFFGFI